MLRYLGQSDGRRPDLQSTYDVGCLRHIQNYSHDILCELHYVFTATRLLQDQRSANILSSGLLFPAIYSRANGFSEKKNYKINIKTTRTQGFTLIVTFMSSCTRKINKLHYVKTLFKSPASIVQWRQSSMLLRTRYWEGRSLWSRDERGDAMAKKLTQPLVCQRARDTFLIW